MKDNGDILIYESEDKQTEIEVRLESDTVWLTQNQMASLFNQTKQNISLHINNCFKEKELDKFSVVKESLTVQKEGNRNIKRKIIYYNLDVVISVGYRVKSKRGTQFRIWATQKLKNYLIKGYALNEKLLSNQNNKLKQLHNVIKTITNIASSESLENKDKDNFLLLLNQYSEALNLLDDYDYQRINKIEANTEIAYKFEYDEVKQIIQKMKDELGNSKYFGKEKDESLKSSISAIYQTFDGIDLYPLIIEKATNLLYFLVKNHSFVDGNKRIAAALFLYFLDKNNILIKSNIDNDLLVALTLMIANSKASEKDIIINIVTLILNRTK